MQAWAEAPKNGSRVVHLYDDARLCRFVTAGVFTYSRVACAGGAGNREAFMDDDKFASVSRRRARTWIPQRDYTPWFEPEPTLNGQ